MKNDKLDKIQKTLDEILGEMKKVSGYFDRSLKRVEKPADDQTDDLYEDAKKLVIKSGKASATFLQSKFLIGFARASTLIDKLEEDGIVGPAKGGIPRKVIYKKRSK